MSFNRVQRFEDRAHRILVVDDELLMLEIVKRVLVGDGHEVQTAASGREGLSLFEQNEFDLVVLDYEMPDIKGDELSLVIKALAPNQTIAILTGHLEAVVRSLLTDVDLIMTKPFTAQQLRMATNRILARA